MRLKICLLLTVFLSSASKKEDDFSKLIKRNSQGWIDDIYLDDIDFSGIPRKFRILIPSFMSRDQAELKNQTLWLKKNNPDFLRLYNLHVDVQSNILSRSELFFTKDKTFDGIKSSYEGRIKELTYNEPLYVLSAYIFFNKSIHDFKSFRDLKNRSFAHLRNAHFQRIQQLIPGIQSCPLDTEGQIVKMVYKGRCDFGGLTKIHLKYYLKKIMAEDLSQLENLYSQFGFLFLTHVENGIWFRKDSELANYRYHYYLLAIKYQILIEQYKFREMNVQPETELIESALLKFKEYREKIVNRKNSLKNNENGL